MPAVPLTSGDTYTQKYGAGNTDGNTNAQDVEGGGVKPVDLINLI